MIKITHKVLFLHLGLALLSNAHATRTQEGWRSMEVEKIENGMAQVVRANVDAQTAILFIKVRNQAYPSAQQLQAPIQTTLAEQINPLTLFQQYWNPLFGFERPAPKGFWRSTLEPLGPAFKNLPAKTLVILNIESETPFDSPNGVHLQADSVAKAVLPHTHYRDLYLIQQGCKTGTDDNRASLLHFMRDGIMFDKPSEDQVLCLSEVAMAIFQQLSPQHRELAKEELVRSLGITNSNFSPERALELDLKTVYDRSLGGLAARTEGAITRQVEKDQTRIMKSTVSAMVLITAGYLMQELSNSYSARE